MKAKTKQQAIMAAATAGFVFVGFQFFVLFLIKGWRIYPVELCSAIVVGGLLGWAAFPKNAGACIKIGVITGVILAYALLVMTEKDV